MSAAETANKAIRIANEQWEQDAAAATNTEEQHAAADRFSKASSGVGDQFREDLIKEAGIEGYDEVNSLIFAKAYSDGHSDGWDEIEYHFLELATFTKRVKDAL